ncbi:flavin reductase family protein [uncultured Rhodoblastus sp.]|uniref:flavin reductase family protein n=1 Tax=uncultured Rhodoblastus sp. TaxID=543037 RepID=UPI0025D682C6|nr:flavin reductase family protein [uncultured Rhodoblastus sp.]
MFYEPASRDRKSLPHDPFKALVAPRPIGWISTKSRAGEINLAPYSFFNALAGEPPLIGFSSEGPKDSASFARDSGEFVWNMATYELREAMNASAAAFSRGVNEFVAAGLEMAPCRIVKAPRVAASPCSLECRVTEIFALKDVNGEPVGNILTVGQVVGVHIDERFLHDGRFDLAAARTIVRCGYAGDYALIERLFKLERPK